MESSPTPASANACLQTLYQEHHHWLHRWLRQRIGRPEHAADIRL